MYEIIQKNFTWKCPFKKKICKCKHCLKNRDSEKKNQNVSLYSAEAKKHNIEKNTSQEQQISQAQQYAKAKDMQKLKNFIDFNGNLMQKFSKTIKTLNTQEIIFYHRIIYESLEKLDSIVRKKTKK